MKSINIKASYASSLFIIGFGMLCAGFVLLPANAHAESSEKCVFTQDLDINATGDEVRCLQKFLNGKGFIIAESGPGSPGSETNQFGGKTKDAVKRWQVSQNLYPATGTFGPLSRARYQLLLTTTLTPVSTSGTPVTTTVINTNTGTQAPSVPTTASTNSTEAQVKKLLKSVYGIIIDSEDKIDDAKNLTDEEETDMQEDVDKAKDRLFDAVIAYLNGEYDEAKTLATRAQKTAEDAVEDITDEENMEDAEDAIADAKAALADARAEIAEADDDGDDVGDAEDLYDDAKSKYDDAREAFDDEEYDDAIDLAEEAQDLADEAIDAL